MSFPSDVTGRLIALGFRNDHDFLAHQDATGVLVVDWFSASAMPNDATIAGVDMTAAAAKARSDAVEPDLATLRDQAQSAFDTNATYLALASPSNAEQFAQLRAITQQQQKIIKALARLAVRTLT